jgi:hypothetical protein
MQSEYDSESITSGS